MGKERESERTKDITNETQKEQNYFVGDSSLKYHKEESVHSFDDDNDSNDNIPLVRKKSKISAIKAFPSKSGEKLQKYIPRANFNIHSKQQFTKLENKDEENVESDSSLACNVDG